MGPGYGKVTSAVLLVFILAAGMFFYSVPEMAKGATLFVGSASTHPTIASALENATSGDTIVVGSGQYPERIDVILSRLTIRGNNTDQVILAPSSGAQSRIAAPFVSVSGITFKNNTLNIESKNVTLTSLKFDIQGGIAISAEKADTLTGTDLTFKGKPKGCLYVANSSMVHFSQVRPAGTETTVVEAYKVNALTLDRNIWDLTGIGTGAMVRGIGAVIDDTKVLSRSDTVGIDFMGDSLYIRNFSSSVKGVGLKATGNYISLMGSSIKASASGDVGIWFENALNITLNRTSFDVGPGALGIRARSSSDILYKDSSIDMTGSYTRFLEGAGVVRGKFTDLVATVKGDDQTFMHLRPEGLVPFGSDRLTIANSSFFLSGERSSVLVLNGSISTNISKNLFTMTGNGSVSVNGSGPGFYLEHNSFSINSGSSTGAVLYSSNCTVIDQVFVQYGVGSTGLVIHGQDGEVRNSSFISFSDADAVILKGARNDIVRSSFYENGAGTCLISSGSTDCSVKKSNFGLIGDGSEGIIVLGSSTFIITDSLIDAMAGAGTPIRSMMSMMLISDTSIKYNSSSAAVDVTGGSVHLDGVSARSADYALSALGADLAINDSVLSGAVLLSSTASIVGCDLRSGTTDLHAKTSSDVDLLDTKAPSVIADATSVVRASSTLVLFVADVHDDPRPDVEVSISNDRGSAIYRSPGFGGADPRTDLEGRSDPFIALDRIYGLGAKEVRTTARLAISGTAVKWDRNYTINTSVPGTIVLKVGDIDFPKTPENIRVRALSTHEAVLVQWDPNDDDTLSYRVYMQDGQDWTEMGAVDHPTSSWVSPDLGPAEKRVFRVSAFDGTWESAPSQTAANSTLDLTSPMTPVLTLESDTPGMLTVEWTSGFEPDLAGFTLEMNSTASMTQFKTVFQAGPLETSVRITGLSPGTTYGFRVRSFDLSDNHSPYSALVKGNTMPWSYSIRITVVYDGGPMDAQPASQATVRLINFNGTLIGTMIADPTGKAVFTGLQADESYMIEASPETSLKGIEGVLTGYLENASGFIETSGGGTTIAVDLILPYYFRPVYGSVSVSVVYGSGPRNDAVYNALVDLKDSTGSTVESRSTDDLGMASFVMRSLPFDGYMRVIPPSAVAAVPGRKAGYLEATSDRFNVTVSDPDAGTLNVMLEYESYEMPPRPLLIVWKSPTGRGVNLNAPIVVTFNQAVSAGSVEQFTTISPSPKNVEYVWSNKNQTVTIVHEGFMQDTVYRVSLARNVISAEGTSFPVGYANNTWEFKTGDDNARSDLTRIMIYAIIALVAIILIGLAIFIYLKQPPRIDLEIEEDEPDPYSYDYPEDEIIDGSVEEEEGGAEMEHITQDPTDVDDREVPEDSIDPEGSPEDEEVQEADDDGIEMLEDDDDFPDEPDPEVNRTVPKPRLRVLKGS